MASPAEATSSSRVLPYPPRGAAGHPSGETRYAALSEPPALPTENELGGGTVELAPIRRFGAAAAESLAAGAPPALLERALAQRIMDARNRSGAHETRAQADEAVRRAVIEACAHIDGADADRRTPHSSLAQYARAGVVLQRARLVSIGAGGASEWLRLFHSCVVFTPFEELEPGSLNLLSTMMRAAMSTPADVGVIRQALVRGGFRVIPAGALHGAAAGSR